MRNLKQLRCIYYIWITIGLIQFAPINSLAQDQTAQADSLGFRLLEEANAWRVKNNLSKANMACLQAGQIFFDQKNWKALEDAYEALYRNYRITNTKQEFQSIIDYFAQADSLLSTLPQDTALNAKARVLGRIAYLYHRRGDYPEALNYYERALIPAEQVNDQYFLLRLYSSAASILWALADDQRALHYRDKAISMAYAQKDTIAIIYNLTESGINWSTIDPVKAVPYFKKSLALEPDNSLTLALLSKTYLLEETRDHKTAMRLAQKAFKYANGDTEKSDALHQVGRVYFDLKKYDRALKYYRQALEYGKQGYGEGHPEYLKILKYMGDAHRTKKQFTSALKAYNQCLDKLLPLFKPKSPDQNPKVEQLINYSVWILESLQGKSEVYSQRFKESKKIEDKLKALSTAELSIQYLQKLEQSYGQDESKYQMRNHYYSISESAIATAFDLADYTNDKQYLEKAFAISENNKALVLSETLFRKEIKQLAGIPDSLLQLEKQYHEEISFWKKKIFNAEEQELRDTQDSLFSAYRELEKFEKGLEKDYPDYASAKFGHFIPQRISDIQEALSDSSLLIEYFLTDSNICFFAIDKNSFQALRRPKEAGFDQQLDRFLQTINDWKFVQDSSAVASRDFLHSAHFLYKNLFHSFLEQSPPQKLIIIPDGKLGLLPFELLLTKPYEGKWTDRDIPFLIKQVPISYQFSTKFLSKSVPPLSGKWGGFGAEYNESFIEDASSLSLRDEGRLPYADDEVRMIASFTGGTSWLNEEATRANFLNYAEDYGILHLATHGILNQKNPLQSHLLFSRSIASEEVAVYAHEIYAMQLNAGLTVLSACNTGAGTWKRGEGIMSLARAFSFAGCPSVVMSMWSVSDQSTAKIMTDFYKNLQKGQSKDLALQRAKLNYLQSASTEYTKPIYWASFVAIGDMSTIPMTGPENHYWWKRGLFITIVILLFLIYIFQKKKLE